MTEPERQFAYIDGRLQGCAWQQAGIYWSVNALWLGHETIETTLTYLNAHLELKEPRTRQAEAVRPR
ncbi:hypothetical protein [Mesorhizobium sp. M0118]|uniref:hypothetical protein n=1 Tax=Mesorhizobium sp. M0118 TaxID=2956884 RepID=UPI00333B04E5